MKALVPLVSSAVSAALIAGAIAIGGGTPVAPQKIANSAQEAARNVAEAEDNTSQSARDTESLATIARNVASQLGTSRRMFEIQLGIERSATDAAASSRRLNEQLAAIGRALGDLEAELRDLSLLSTRSASTSQLAALRAAELQQTIGVLRSRFERVTELSRRLNRKARGYEEAKDGSDG